MVLIELIESDEGFFLEGYAQGWIYKRCLGDLVLQKPIWGAIEGSSIRRFHLKEEERSLYVEYRNSVSQNFMSIELGEVSDLDKAKNWIEQVNKLYENKV